jgi:hypothetical protein
MGIQLNCDIPHTVGDSLQCTGKAMVAPAERECFRAPEFLITKIYLIQPSRTVRLLVFTSSLLTEYSLSRGRSAREEGPHTQFRPEVGRLGAPRCINRQE